jgi:hypothetical protein
VADDVELAWSARTWAVAAVEFSAVPPLRSTIPVTSLDSRAVDSLGLCIPADVSEPGRTGWSATLWQVGGDAGSATVWQPVALLTPSPRSLGAMADPLNQSVVAWPPGRYILETRFDGLQKEAWLGLLISPTPAATAPPPPRTWPRA